MNLGGIGSVIESGAGVFSEASEFASDPSLSNMVDLVGAASNALETFTAVFLDNTNNPADWRVKLSIPSPSAYQKSPILKPLRDAGGMVFPYTPSVTIGNKALYQNLTPTHMNFEFATYQRSMIDDIRIVAPMNVETSEEAAYWIAALHYFQSVTKMFTGQTDHVGNPPPVVTLNGYGKHMLNNIPVVVTLFSVELPKDCDYIPVNISGSLLAEASAVAGEASSMLGDVGNAMPILSGVTNIGQTVASVVGAAAGIASKFFDIPSGENTSYVPTTSTFNITLKPVYSRRSALQFNTGTFVQGGYLNNINKGAGYL